MKKKGLIIATIVMVLVLAVSLTTATYAWFSAESRATINTISIATANASDVLVGMSIDHSTTTSLDGYVSGTLSGITTGTVSGDPGCGPAIDTGISLTGLNQAIGTGTVSNNTVSAIDTSWVAANTVIKANGTYTKNEAGTSVVSTTASTTGADVATKNADYIDWHLGFQPTKALIDTITINITINPTDTKVALGMLAALHVRYSINGGAYVEKDLYGSNTYNTSKSSSGMVSAVDSDATATNATANDFASITGLTVNAGALNLPITIGTAGTPFGIDNIQTLHLQLYYAGYDLDCVNEAMGTAADIIFTITNTEKPAAPAQGD